MVFPIREYNVGLCLWRTIKSTGHLNIFDEAQKILIYANSQMILIGAKELSDSGMFEYKLVRDLDINSGQIKNLKSMTVSRERFSAVYLDKEIFVFGGLNGTALNTVEK